MTRGWITSVSALVVAACMIALPWPVHADPPPGRMTLRDAIRFALDHSPALEVEGATEIASARQVEVARAQELPQVGVSAEVLRATGNVVPGSLFPMTGIPSVAGPPMNPPHFDGGAWGSALGLWGDWNFSDLARRMRLVDAALADVQQTRAATAARRLDVAFQTVDAFVALSTARETVRALRANLDRARTLVTSVQTLTATELRAGADLSRAQAEVARALTLVAQAEQGEAIGRARLAEVLGVAGHPVDIAPDALGDVSGNLPAPTSLEEHPLRRQAEATIRAAELRRQAVDLEYLPRLDVVAALWMRGSGYFTAVTDLGAAQGLLPDTPNWSLGVVASWPVFDLFVIRARARVAEAHEAVERARRDELVQTLVGQVDAARAALEGAARVAAQSAPALVAARTAEGQATARYQSGLATLLDVADAQRLLAEADLQNALAHAAVWRARLLIARAVGDLGPFLAPEALSTPGAR